MSPARRDRPAARGADGGRRGAAGGKRSAATRGAATHGAGKRGATTGAKPAAKGGAPGAAPGIVAFGGKDGCVGSPPQRRNFWLLKTEPTSYSIADLQRDGVTGWDGVRNYQARNSLRDQMRVGDGVLFYHSNADPPAIVGLAEVASRPRPDTTAFDPQHDHHDPASDPEKPTWFLVDIRHVETFAEPLGRDTLALVKELRRMVLLQRGSRLSVQPVAPEEFALIVRLAHAASRDSARGRAAP